MKLRRGKYDDRFEKIESGRDWSATAMKNFIGDNARNKRASRRYKWDRGGEDQELRGFEIDVVHLPHEEWEPLVDSLSHSAGARVGTGNNPNHRICDDDFKYVEHLRLDATTRFLLRIYRRKTSLLGRVFHDKRHASSNHERDSRRNPE